VLHVVLFIPRDPMSLVLPMIVFTIAVYPLLVLFLNVVFRVEKPVSRDFAGGAAR
jgi:hypothetical protein